MRLNPHAYLIFARFLIFGPGRAYGYDKRLKRIFSQDSFKPSYSSYRQPANLPRHDWMDREMFLQIIEDSHGRFGAALIALDK